MFAHLKQRFASWFREWVKTLLIEDESNDLEVHVPGKGIVRVSALAIAGLLLHIRLPDGNERLIGVRDAVVEDRYWRIWGRLGGDRLQWPDGKKFDPTGRSS